MSKITNFINKIKTRFAITSTELYAVILLAIGAIVGFLIDPYSKNRDLLLDAINQVDETTFDTTLIFHNQPLHNQKTDTVSVTNFNNITTNEISEGYNDNEQFYDKSEATTAKLSKKDALEKFNRKIDLNIASKSELMKLPGVGDKTAESIINYRQQQRFNRIEDIMNIKGIGQKKFEKMKDFIQVSK